MFFVRMRASSRKGPDEYIDWGYDVKVVVASIRPQRSPVVRVIGALPDDVDARGVVEIGLKR